MSAEPARPQWIEVFEYELVRVARLPVPNEIREPACMIGPKVWIRRRVRRWVPWLVPRQAPRGCCWHHRVDWRQAAAAAIRLLGEARAAGVADEDLDHFLITRLHGEGNLGDREQSAVLALAAPGAGIQLADSDNPWRYFEGQHRVAAQIDQGVRKTVVQRFEVLDPATGLPPAELESPTFLEFLLESLPGGPALKAVRARRRRMRRI